MGTLHAEQPTRERVSKGTPLESEFIPKMHRHESNQTR